MKLPSQTRRRILAAGAAAARARPAARPGAGLPFEEHARRDPDRPGRRRRPPGARVRRLLGAAAQDELRVRLLRRRRRAGGLRALSAQARARRPQPALRQHGAGDDHVRPAEAEIPLSRGLPVLLPARRGRQRGLCAAPEPVPAARGPGRRGEKARGERGGQPPAAPGVDRHARPRQRDQGEIQPGALRRRQSDLGRGDERRGGCRRAADRRGGRARRPDARARHLQRRRGEDGEVQRATRRR